MSSNHQSFLKMIGMHEPGTGHDLKAAQSPDTSEASENRFSGEVSKTPTIELRSWDQAEELPPLEVSAGEASQSASATDWDLEQHATLAEQQAQFDEQERAQEEQRSAEPDVHERFIEDTPREFTKTENYTKTEHMAEEREERTEALPQNRTEAMPQNRQSHIGSAEKSETFILSQSMQHTQAVDAHTRATVALDYGPDADAQARTNATAHFNYDDNEADTSGSRVVVLDGNVSARAFHLGQLPLRIGRDILNEVVIDDTNCSRFHAEIREDALGRLVVVDLDSTNGIKANGALVSEHALNSHDIIQIGDALFEFLGPGILSKGVPLTNVMQEGSSYATSELDTQKSSKRRKFRMFLLGAIIAGALGFFIVSNRQAIQEGAEQKATEIFADQVEANLSKFRDDYETKMQKTLREVDASDVKTAFMDHVNNTTLAAIIPEDFRTQLKQLDPEVIVVFAEDPALVSALVKNYKTPAKMVGPLRNRTIELVKENRHTAALALAELMATFDPENKEVLEVVEKLKKQVAGEAGPSPTPGVAAAPSAVNSIEEKKFYEYMQVYQKKFDQYVNAGKIDAAITYARVVKERLEDVAVKDAGYEKLMRPILDKWGFQVEELAREHEQTKKKNSAITEQNKKGVALFASIRTHLDVGDVSEARKEMDEFLRKYPNHPDVKEVQSLLAEQDRLIMSSLNTAKQTVEDYLRAENYEAAWKEVYRFLEVLPNEPAAQELRERVSKATMSKASQYYNQARVFEYEADDLLAAEQSYHKAMDYADPKSELSKKAARRYEDVKRKNIH